MIERNANGFWYVKPTGQTQFSATGSTTRDKAEQHLQKLNAGLVRFVPLGRDNHRPAFKPGFANGATIRNRLHRNA